MEGNDFVQGTKLKQSYKDSDLYNHKQYGVSMNFPQWVGTSRHTKKFKGGRISFVT